MIGGSFGDDHFRWRCQDTSIWFSPFFSSFIRRQNSLSFTPSVVMLDDTVVVFVVFVAVCSVVSAVYVLTFHVVLARVGTFSKNDVCYIFLGVPVLRFVSKLATRARGLVYTVGRRPFKGRGCIQTNTAVPARDTFAAGT